ncbi:DUF4132 domain-containing protein [Micromonospora sp. NBC_01813]|uniref:DUF4132 domain-containing protein n=1 Tax=Micromonospora sp. NBC_01813 TaxID=2975988 RepID=UPI002DD9262A|nr:DUF4132 domain-containing protein [Micromonospora sp. NBC_01813]WSA08516.1 DUF4132 domain-containing protein [Micromonospora sp. NBC_01813]
MRSIWRVERVRELVAAGELVDLAGYLQAHSKPALDSKEVWAVLRTLSRPDLVRLLCAMIEASSAMRGRSWTMMEIISRLLRRLPDDLTVADARVIADFAVAQWHVVPPGAVEVVARRLAAAGPLPEALLQTVVHRSGENARLRQLMVELGVAPLSAEDPWAEPIMAELPTLDPLWPRLVAQASVATAARPSAAWTSEARDLLAGVDPDQARTVLGRWLGLACRTPERVPQAANADVLRGLLWLVELTDPKPEQVRQVGALVEVMLRRLPGIGPACPKVANAAVGVLGRLDSEAALAQLARLSARLTYKGTRKEVDKALDARAAAMGVSRAEIEELAVPDYGLSEVGRHEVPAGGCRVELQVSGTATTVTWFNESGRAVKSPPAAVRRDHPQVVADVKVLAKDVAGMLVAQSARLDGLFLAQRSWTLSVWLERYLDHPLVGTLARRLIWLVDGVPCGWVDDALRTVDDAPVSAAADASVQLWHPIGRPVPEVVAWRDWLEWHGVVQPFKQAHREVYLLTPAEETTGTYSNRFAGHILRQHQYHALAAARGWADKLRLMVDDVYPPTVRELPQWGLRAEYWVEGIGDDYGVDTTDAGSYLRLVTDQVRFYPIDAATNSAHASGGGYGRDMWRNADGDPAEPLPLDQVPPLVLSEVMRDVDLFVGVSSVGNDPTWSDGGPQGRYRDYWTSYSFGELSATAQTRRDLLVRLLPRLAVGKQASIDGRFLVVEGELHTYKIHLGSGNILMSPNDRYLCIVPDRSASRPGKQAGKQAGEREFLPFEGDGVLAVILSKAMLLAKDSEITDPTIVAQIEEAR